MLSSTEFHKAFASLRIHINEIGITGLRFVHELQKDAICALLYEPKNPGFSWRGIENTKLSFSLERENDHSFLVKVVGEIALACSCVRCLSELRFCFPMDFSTRMLEMEHLGIDENAALGWLDATEIDLSEQEDHVGYFCERTLDLGLIVRDQIFLLTPDYPHCDMSKDALQASRCKVLSPFLNEADQLRDNPFAKKFGKTK
jgi:uncharacterized metal-binding protein YceD (DUF177 family)